MLFSSAVSFLATFAGFAATPSPQVKTGTETFVSLIQNGRTVGVAACISEKGKFIAHRSAFVGSEVDARIRAGTIIRLKVAGEDRVTRLICLDAGSPLTGSWTSLLPPVDGGSVELQAVGPRGISNVQMVDDSRFGILGDNLRLVPLCEVRLEESEGALVNSLFVRGTEFRGVLVSSLSIPDQPPTANFSALSQNFQAYGPGALQISFITGPKLVRRAMNAFLAGESVVRHPFLGIVCRNALAGGAEIVTVSKNSPGQKAGLRVGDVLVEIEGKAVRRQLDFARTMMQQEIGDRIMLVVNRAGRQVRIDAVVGGSTD